MLERTDIPSRQAHWARKKLCLLEEQNDASCWQIAKRRAPKRNNRNALAQSYMEARSLWNRRPRPLRTNVVKLKRTKIFNHKKNEAIGCNKRTSLLSRRFTHQTNKYNLNFQLDAQAVGDAVNEGEVANAADKVVDGEVVEANIKESLGIV